jgi:hypothetical protein
MAASRSRVRSTVLLVAVFVFLTLALAACGPEDNRVDGDGKKSGADIGNWGEPVQMHGSKPYNTRVYYRTPDESPAQ